MNFKKHSLFLLIIGLCLVAVGFIGLKGNMSNITNLYNLDNQYEEKNISLGDISTSLIDIDTVNRKIVFTPSLTNKINIKYFDSKDDSLTVTNESNLVKVKNIYKNRILSLPRWVSKEKRTIYIELPTINNFDIKINGINGDVIVDDLSNILTLNVNSINSNLTLNNILILNHLSFNTVNGNVSIEQSSIKKIDLTSVNGKYNLKSLVSENITAKSTNSQINIELIGIPLNYKITTHTLNGKSLFNKVKIENGIHQPIGIYHINTSTTNGNINITIKE